MPHPNVEPFTHDGLLCQPIARGVILRADKMIGLCHHSWTPDKGMHQVRWRTVQQIATWAGVEPKVIVQRLKDRWNAGELNKPAGFERVVDARRNGIRTPRGDYRSLKGWAEYCGVTVLALEQRLMRGWSLNMVVSPSANHKRYLVDSKPTNVPDRPTITARGGCKGQFWFKGAIDDLPGHCRAHGLSVHTVRARLRNGCTFEQAMDPLRRTRSDKGKPNPKRGYRENYQPEQFRGVENEPLKTIYCDEQGRPLPGQDHHLSAPLAPPAAPSRPHSDMPDDPLAAIDEFAASIQPMSAAR